jgi:propanediol dehydratase small subunit
MSRRERWDHMMSQYPAERILAFIHNAAGVYLSRLACSDTCSATIILL